MFDYISHSFGNKHLVARKAQQYVEVIEKADYENCKYCLRCGKNFPKYMMRCPIFNHNLRSRPTRNKKKVEFKRY